MAISVNSRRTGWPSGIKPPKVDGLSPFAQVLPVEQKRDLIEQMPSAAKKALEELEEKYTSLVKAVKVDIFKPENIEEYILRAEKRRGAPFTRAERDRFRDMAKSGDPEKIRLVALELRFGVPRKVERAALAAFGNLILYRDQVAPLREFLDKPGKDPNLVAYVKTILMMNRVERWMEKYQNWRDRLSGFVPLPAIQY